MLNIVTFFSILICITYGTKAKNETDKIKAYIIVMCILYLYVMFLIGGYLMRFM